MSKGKEEKVADIQGAATVDWSPLGDIFTKYVYVMFSASPDSSQLASDNFYSWYLIYNCRKYLNYNLSWDVNLAESHVAMAPYGGPVGKATA